MRHIKALGLAAIAIGSLVVVAGQGTASATTLTCSSGIHCSVNTTVTGASEGHVVFDSPVGKVECNSNFHLHTFNTGGSTETVVGDFDSISFTGCTNGAVATVLSKGFLTYHTASQNIDNNGSVTLTEFTVTIEFAGFHCIYGAEGVFIGTLTGSTTTGKTATLDIAATLPRHGGRSGAFCGTTIPWTGFYSTTSPDFLNVD